MLEIVQQPEDEPTVSSAKKDADITTKFMNEVHVRMFTAASFFFLGSICSAHDGQV